MSDFTPEQMQQISTAVRAGVRDALGDAGLRVDTPDAVDAARRDFMFMRTLRLGANGVAAKVGWFVIAALLGAVVAVLGMGLAAWRDGRLP